MGFGWNQAISPDSNWLAAAIRPYVLAAIDAFSPSRCMFASNFPVDAASYGYGILWNAFKRVATCYSFDEQRELLHDTAARVYRLPG
jgi:L-fuconolactonase